jgi:hypothetical protein
VVARHTLTASLDISEALKSAPFDQESKQTAEEILHYDTEDQKLNRVSCFDWIVV